MAINALTQVGALYKDDIASEDTKSNFSEKINSLMKDLQPREASTTLSLNPPVLISRHIERR